MPWFSNRRRSPMGKPVCRVRPSGDLRLATAALGAAAALTTA